MISYCLVCERAVDINAPNRAGIIPTETDCSIVCRPCVKLNLSLLIDVGLDPIIGDSRDHSGWSEPYCSSIRKNLTKMVPSQ
jgi:hypothetical protein